jgi:hypothetical protein
MRPASDAGEISRKGVDVEGGILWFWIGEHAEYDRLVG